MYNVRETREGSNGDDAATAGTYSRGAREKERARARNVRKTDGDDDVVAAAVNFSHRRNSGMMVRRCLEIKARRASARARAGK